ncbi:MAG: hypothetical protein COB10_06665 [Planctomycetota bacterium]|jgi:hypothetical protein|nr:MAG: hypothetical protein COB10_06665 [Planctomycetota bacterium]
MPSTSKRQRKFMAAAANSPGFAKKAGISQSVAKDFHGADKRKRKKAGSPSMIAALTSENKGYA